MYSMTQSWCFFTHPKSVCMTYFQHFRFSMKLSMLFIHSSIKGIIHAIFPWLFITYAKDTTETISFLLNTNGCNKELKHSGSRSAFFRWSDGTT